MRWTNLVSTAILAASLSGASTGCVKTIREITVNTDIDPATMKPRTITRVERVYQEWPTTAPLQMDYIKGVHP